MKDYFKYKDALPCDTIKRIKRILEENEIHIVENSMRKSLGGLYSVRIQIEDTEFGANGKGITEVYALASAYAELMERLQNGMLLPDNEKINFSKALGTREVNIINQAGSPLISDVLNIDNVDKNELIKLWSVIGEGYTQKGEEYKEINSGNTAVLPCAMSLVYGSNGMASGNSYYEAVVQGCCEVFERYAARKIINGTIIPPTIDTSFVTENCKGIEKYINEIKQKGDYTVLFKDCSLNMGLPVVAICLIDKKNSKYFVTFGSHPKFHLAIERAFTEMFQGKTIQDMIIPLEAQSDMKLGLNNDLHFFQNGCGYISNKFFFSKPDYSFDIGVFDTISKNNYELYIELKEFLSRRKIQAYIKDVNHLGFPAIHIIIPGMSVIFPQDYIALRYRIMRGTAIRSLENYGILNKHQKVELLSFIDYNRKVAYGQSFLNKTFSKKIKFLNHEYEKSYLIFLLLAYFNLGMYKECKHIIGVMRNNFPDNDMQLFLKALEYGICMPDININSLELLFPKHICDYIRVVADEKWFDSTFIYEVLNTK